MAGWMVVVGSVLVVLLAFSQVSDLRSLQSQESIEDYLSTSPGDSLGIGVQGVQTLLRITAMVAAACAAAAAILGWQVLQRSKGARIALSVLAVPLLLSGLVSGGFVSAVVVAAIVMLWFQPSRDWFDGRTPPPRPEPLAAPRATPVGRDPLLDLPPPTAPPLHPTPYASGPSASASVTRVESGERPAAVRWACVLTWAFAGLTFSVLALTVIVALTQPDTLLEEVRRQNADLAAQGISEDELTTTLYAVATVMMVWAAAALALSVLAWRRVRWAWLALIVSAACASVLCLVMLVGSVLMVVPMAVCAAAVSLLLRPESRRWYAVSGR